MNYFEGMLQTIGQCVTLLVVQEPATFGLTLLVGIVLAALCWWAATHYSRLFNLTFQITRLHQVLCACAAVLTLLFCVLFVSLKFTQQIAQNAIDAWYRQVSQPAWRYQVYTKLYYAVQATGQEDFRTARPPGDPKSWFPNNKPLTRHMVASMPANEALHVFQRTNPFLSRVLSLPNRIPDAAVVADQSAFFAQHPSGLYNTDRSVNLAATQIRSRLIPETPKAVLYARLLLTACFLLAQAVPFLWIGFAAYRDLKVGT